MPLKFSTIKDVLPTAASAFVLTGILKALAFYYLFGIRIIDYVDFSESLLLFLDDLIIFCFALLYAGLSAFLYRQYPASLLYMGIILIAGNSIYLYVLLRNYYHISMYFSIVQPLAVLIISLVGFFYLYRQIVPGKADLRLEIKIVAVLAFLSLISTVIFRIKKDYDHIVKDDADRQVKCVFSDSTQVTTGKDTLYIGRTKHNLFFYVKSEKKALIYKEDEVKKIEIKTLKYPQIKYSL